MYELVNDNLDLRWDEILEDEQDSYYESIAPDNSDEEVFSFDIDERKELDGIQM